MIDSIDKEKILQRDKIIDLKQDVYFKWSRSDLESEERKKYLRKIVALDKKLNGLNKELGL